MIQLVLRQFLYHKFTEMERSTKYQYVLYVRGDYSYLCPFPLDKVTGNKTASGIWIGSKDQNNFGYSDRDTLASGDLFAETFSVFLSVVTETDATCFTNANFESALKCHFELQSLQTPRFYDGPMITVRNNNTVVRAKEGVYNKELNVILKHPREYTRAKRGCGEQGN